MNINEFVEQRKGDWQLLERILLKFKPGAKPKLGRDELWELGRLYTAAISDLSTLNSSKLAGEADREIIQYLNGLVIRAHGAIYRKKGLELRSIVRFFVEDFPRTFRRLSGFVALSAALFIGCGLGGFLLGSTDPGFIELIMPERIIQGVEKGRVWFNDLYSVAPLASSRLMTHNVSVTLLMVAAGITFGVGTCYLLALNGLVLGAAAALCHEHNLALEFWSFVLPHGVLELSAIFIAGAGGLVIGHALVDPGPYKRLEFLSMRGRIAMRLALGCVPLLVIAGLVEAFLSPSPLPAWAKLAFAMISLASLAFFLVLGGRDGDRTWNSSANTQH
ncbi:MAG: stage II sporulation protein M [Deltaproteobacteria bacterium]|nr:stage II sporulation protein M [Deltaproteobacteria bacterium]